MIDVVWVTSTTTPLVTCNELQQLVRMLVCIALYWTKKFRTLRINGIRFSKDVAKHKSCKIIDVKVLLLFLLVFWSS